ncbi:MAG: hypothetical protein HOC71_01705 [Candidatus Latescibacteria bacterium]|jgi:hypothetical protein|nr:hypothetical protein [Candidatus Latescibacterota bacterium]
MINNLENVIGESERPKFKSDGERRIAYFLEDNSIRYQYESGVLINSDNKPRIWYPDFHLPEFGTYLEYYGLAGKQDYDKGIKTKETVYSKMRLDVIPVYPWMFAEDWQGYIMKELKNVTAQRYRKLMNKPYWSKTSSRPYGNSFRSSKRPFYR